MVVVTHEMGFARKAASAWSSSPTARSSSRPPRGVLHQPQERSGQDFLGKILTH